MSEWLKNNANIRGLIAIFCILLLGVLLTALIVNPNSLNPETNQIINVLVGSLMTIITGIFNYFFQKNEGTEKQNR